MRRGSVVAPSLFFSISHLKRYGFFFRLRTLLFFAARANKLKLFTPNKILAVFLPVLFPRRLTKLSLEEDLTALAEILIGDFSLPVPKLCVDKALIFGVSLRNADSNFADFAVIPYVTDFGVCD